MRDPLGFRDEAILTGGVCSGGERRRPRRWRTLPIAFALGAASCATQSDIGIVRQDVREARTSAADAQAAVASLRHDVELLRGEVEAVKFQGANVKTDDLNARIAALDTRIAAIEQGARPSPVEGGTGAAGVELPAGQPPPMVGVETETPSAGTPAEYRDGLDAIRRNDFQGAIQKFREFLRRSPKSDLADNAQYWIGEAYYQTKDYNRAILEFNEVLLRYPRGDKVPAALLRQAYAFSDLGDKVDARLVLQKLLSEHGGSPEAERGRQKLAELSG